MGSGLEGVAGGLEGAGLWGRSILGDAGTLVCVDRALYANGDKGALGASGLEVLTESSLDPGLILTRPGLWGLLEGSLVRSKRVRSAEGGVIGTSGFEVLIDLLGAGALDSVREEVFEARSPVCWVLVNRFDTGAPMFLSLLKSSGITSLLKVRPLGGEVGIVIEYSVAI